MKKIMKYIILMRGNVMSLYQYCTENNLSALLAEYSKDNPIPTREIGFKSTIKCKWICQHGYEEY